MTMIWTTLHSGCRKVPPSSQHGRVSSAEPEARLLRTLADTKRRPFADQACSCRQGWAERPVFGKIRYMNLNGARAGPAACHALVAVMVCACRPA